MAAELSTRRDDHRARGFTLYKYNIIVGGTDLNLVSDTFRTAPMVGSGAVSFVALGDSGTGSPEQRHIDALIENESFDFALHSGDLAYGAVDGTGTGTFQTTSDWFFSIYQNWLRSRPVFPVNGNHDSRAANGNGLPYLGLFVLPTNGASATYPDHAERYYSFDYGPIHVVALDTEYTFLDSSRRAAQLAWLQADLGATGQPWKIALFHRPPYSAGGEHGSAVDVRTAFNPIFEQFGVQLAIGGHEHDYERTWPLRAGVTDPTGVTYIVTGGGGAPLYPSSTATWTAYSATRFHYLRGAADSCSLQINAVGDEGPSSTRSRSTDVGRATRCPDGIDCRADGWSHGAWSHDRYRQCRGQRRRRRHATHGRRHIGWSRRGRPVCVLVGHHRGDERHAHASGVSH